MLINAVKSQPAPLDSCLLHQLQSPAVDACMYFCFDQTPLLQTIRAGQSLNMLFQCKTICNTLIFCPSLAPSKACDNSARIFSETRIKL